MSAMFMIHLSDPDGALGATVATGTDGLFVG